MRPTLCLPPHAFLPPTPRPLSPRAVKQMPHVIDFEVSDSIAPMLFKQLGDQMTAARKDWVKRNKKKKGGKGKKKKKKK